LTRFKIYAKNILAFERLNSSFPIFKEVHQPSSGAFYFGQIKKSKKERER